MQKLMLPSDALALQQDSNTATSATLYEGKKEWVYEGHGFFIHNFGLLIPNSLHCEIIDQFTLCPIPCTQTWFHGMTHLRGGIVPVFDLQQMLGFSPMPTSKRKRKLLVIRSHQDPLGILIDKLPTTIRFSAEQRLTRPPAPPSQLVSFCKGYFKRECVWIDWHMNPFFESYTQRNAIQTM